MSNPKKVRIFNIVKILTLNRIFSLFFSLYFFFLIFFRDQCWKPVLLLCFLLYLGVGYFIYVDSSRNRPGDKARLRSPRLNGTQCMSFYYNFYGDTMSCVIAYIKTAYGSENILWIKSGHWGDRWIKTQIEISEQKADYWVSISMCFFPHAWKRAHSLCSQGLCRLSKINQNRHLLPFLLRLSNNAVVFRCCYREVN